MHMAYGVVAYGMACGTLPSSLYISHVFMLYKSILIHREKSYYVM